MRTWKGEGCEWTQTGVVRSETKTHDGEGVQHSIEELGELKPDALMTGKGSKSNKIGNAFRFQERYMPPDTIIIQRQVCEFK